MGYFLSWMILLIILLSTCFIKYFQCCFLTFFFTFSHLLLLTIHVVCHSFPCYIGRSIVPLNSSNVSIFLWSHSAFECLTTTSINLLKRLFSPLPMHAAHPLLFLTLFLTHPQWNEIFSKLPLPAHSFLFCLLFMVFS